MPSADVSARLLEVLQDIAATERGQERAWLNVQPCVLHTVKLLAAAALSREAQLQQLANTVHEAQECLSILVRDREVKEERYRLDVAAHQTETEQLWKRVLLLEAQQQQQQQQAISCSTSPPSLSQSPALEERLAVLEHELHNVQRRLQVSPPQRPRSARRLPSARSSSLSSSSANSTQRGVGGGDLAAPSPVSRTMMAEVQRLRRQWRHFLHSVPQAALVDDSDEAVDDAEGNVYTRGARAGGARSATPQHTTVSFTRQRAASIRKKMRDLFSDPAVNSDDAADTEEHGAYRNEVLRRDRVHRGMAGLLSSSGRRVRWYWAGEMQGRVPTAANLSPYSRAAQRAQRRAGTGEAPSMLPWTEWHAFDGRTDCWYSLGTWATHRQQLRAVELAEEEEEATAARPARQHARFGWVARAAELVTWTQPARITIRRGGVYEVRVCLVRHRSAACTKESTKDVQEAALTLCVNGEAVAGVRPTVSSILLYAQSPTRRRPSPLRETKMPDSGRHACGCSSGGPSSLPQHTHMEEAYRLLQRRPCCQPAQLQTHTITTCLYLPAGVVVEVRCREPPTTHSLCEAFCELAYVV